MIRARNFTHFYVYMHVNYTTTRRFIVFQGFSKEHTRECTEKRERERERENGKSFIDSDE
jgi:hypothetical protein